MVDGTEQTVKGNVMMDPTLSGELIETLQMYGSPTTSNALERVKVRDKTTGYPTNELVYQFPGVKPMVAMS